jgi:hypothetical protein
MPPVFENIIETPAAPLSPEALLQAKKDRTVANANRLLRQGYEAVVFVHNSLIETVNRNGEGLTPTQVAATFGTRGGALLGLAAKVGEIVALIAQVQGVAVPAGTLATAPAGLTFGVAEDGSLTVTEG